MSAEQKNCPGGKVQPYDSMLQFAAHLVWSMLGPMALMFLLVSIMSRGGGWYTAVDVVYLVALVLVVGCRWTLQRCGRAVTTDGALATWPQFRRWMLVLILLAGVGWAAANLVGQYFARGLGAAG